MDKHEIFMRKALEEARLAEEEGEIPVGAVVVCKGRVIARAHNQTERLNDVTAHAEMLAITSATSLLGGKYLNDCTLYVTLEPCVMCSQPGSSLLQLLHPVEGTAYTEPLDLCLVEGVVQEDGLLGPIGVLDDALQRLQ